jgi:cyclic nucleotide gated channel
MQKKRLLQLKTRDLEWWMKRRQLPSLLRQRVRRFERQRWAATRGVNENEMISDLPEGLRRDIKRHLCLDLIKQVPLFDNVGDLILNNICERVQPLLFTKGEKILREGDPVQRMLFIVKGHLESTQKLSKGMVSTCMLGPGNFCGDELLSWCLRRPFLERLPPSSATFRSLEPTEAFGLDAQDLKYITEHFRYKFANEKYRRIARYYSSSWRTWAAVTIQLVWRKYKATSSLCNSSSVASPLFTPQGINNLLTRSPSDQDLLRLYAAMFTSPKPNDHLE